MSGLPNHFYDLVLACLYGLADEGQSAELSALLEKDAGARQEYIDFLCMYAQLHRRKGACLFVEPSADETLLNEYAWKVLAEEEKRAEAVLVERLAEEPVPAGGGGREEPRRAPVSKLSIYSLILSTAALIFLIAYAYLSPHRGEAASVGRVSRTADAVWQGVSGHMAEGCEVYPGPLKLVKGLAEITLETGARVVLEGPCSVTVETPLQVYLAEGRLSALVKGGSRQAFVVRSPTASVVDYGTEFGVFVKPDGQTEAYVYEGMVQMRDSSDPVRFSKSMLLKKGQSGVSDGDGQLSDLPVNPYHFVRVGDMEVFEQARNIGGYYRWRSWVYRVHREDSSLAGHYFFERDGGDEDCLVNAAGKGGAASGRFGDAGRNKPRWVPGRWPQKEGVRFERGRKQVIVIPAEPSLAFVQPLTISTWIYFPEKGRWGGHLISCRDKYRINYQFSLFDDQYAYQYQKNRFEFRQYDGAGKAGFYSQVFVPEERKWYHFAVVFDGREVRFYVNGELFQAAPYSGMDKASAAEIVLGAMKIDGYVLPEGDFDGVVDELMLFRRCLSGAEIRDIYENGKP